MKDLNIDIKKRGFPINFGPVQFFFGTAAEELIRFFDTQEKYEAEAQKIAEEVQGLKKLENPTKEEVSALLEATQKLAEIQYDGLLGEGAFERIYKEFPDVDQLLELFDDVCLSIAENIEEETEKRKDDLSKKKTNALKKKALKNKKKK